MPGPRDGRVSTNLDLGMVRCSIGSALCTAFIFLLRFLIVVPLRSEICFGCPKVLFELPSLSE
jgi:hypothetical protein